MSDFKQSLLETNGIQLHVTEQGEGPLVLLCHGFPETSYSWRHQLPALAEAGFRAVAALSVPLMDQPPAPPTRIFPQTDEALHYILYFQKLGVAEKEFERDVCSTLRKLFFAVSGEAGPRDESDSTPNPFGMDSVAERTAETRTPTTFRQWCEEELKPAVVD